MIIVVEGLPGCGKTTLINMLKKLKKRLNIISETKEPASLLNKSFLEKQKFFLQNDFKKMENAPKGAINLFDRGYLSTLAFTYSWLKFFNKTKEDYNVIFNLYKRFSLKPSMYIMIDCSVKRSIKNQILRDSSLHPFWGNKIFIKNIKHYYEYFFNNIEKDVPIVRIDSVDVKNVNKLTRIYKKIKEIKQFNE